MKKRTPEGSGKDATHGTRKARPHTGVTVPEHILFDSLLAHAEDMIYFKDRESRFLKLNQAFATRFGFADPSELIGLTDYDIFTAEHAEQAARDEAEIMRTGHPMIGKIEKETWADGRITWASTTKLPLRGADGAIIGTFGISRDVTSQHNAEQNLRRVAHELRVQNEIYEGDLRLASDLFSVFAGNLPARIPEAADIPPAFYCASHYQPAANKLGGDFFMVLTRGQHIRLLVCDVMGHGVQSALVAVMLRTWSQQVSDECETPAEWLERMNQRMAAQFLDSDNCYTATAFACDLHLNSGRMSFSCAGHPPPLLRRAGGTKVDEVYGAQSQGPGLGLFRKSSYRIGHEQMMQGDSLIIYTDGLIEAKNIAGQDFDLGGIVKAVGIAGDQAAVETIARINRAAESHMHGLPPDDDVCILVLQRAAD